MQFTVAVVVAALAGLTAAAPAVESRQTYQACTGLYGNVQCCATDILGLANLDCGSRKCFFFQPLDRSRPLSPGGRGDRPAGPSGPTPPSYAM